MNPSWCGGLDTALTLSMSSVSPDTRKKYDRAVGLFQSFLFHNNTQLASLPSDIDNQILAFIGASFQRDPRRGSLGTCQCVIAGLTLRDPRRRVRSHGPRAP